MEKTLLTPWELDQLFRYPPGRARRLARTGKSPCVVLPDGEIRFDKAEITKIIHTAQQSERQKVFA